MAVLTLAAVLHGPARGDGNPHNPANWTVLSSIIVEGNDRMAHNEYVTVNGVQQIERAVYERTWSEGVWRRNGQAFSEMGIPISKVVWEADTIEALSSGTIKVRLQWNQAPQFPAPSSVRVKVESTAFVLVSDFQQTHRVENGLNSPEETLSPPPWPKIIKRAPEIRTVTVDQNGLAEFTLVKSAQTSKSLPEGVLGGAAWADATGGSMSPDPRYVLITLNGYQLRKKNLETTSSVNITWSVNDHHNHFIPQAPVVFTWPDAIPIEAELTYVSPSVNRAFWAISLPTRFDPPHDVSWQCKHDYQFYGIALGGQLEEGETYTWSDGTTGTLPGNYGWTIPTMDETRFKHHMVKKQSGPKKWNDWEPQPDDIETVMLQYQWADGTIAIAEREIVYREPASIIATSEVVEHTPDVRIQLQFQDGTTRRPAGDSEEAAVFTANAFNKQAASQILGTIGATLELAALAYPPIEIPAVICGALAFAATWIDDESKTDDVHRGDYEEDFTFWVLDGVESESKPLGFNVNEWEWEVMLRPKVLKQLKAYDEYNMNGYVGRLLNVSNDDQAKVRARRLYYFYKNTGGGGGGA